MVPLISQQSQEFSFFLVDKRDDILMVKIDIQIIVGV
jgi:hypothetical protein